MATCAEDCVFGRALLPEPILCGPKASVETCSKESFYHASINPVGPQGKVTVENNEPSGGRDDQRAADGRGCISTS